MNSSEALSNGVGMLYHAGISKASTSDKTKTYPSNRSIGGRHHVVESALGAVSLHMWKTLRGTVVVVRFGRIHFI